MIAMFMREQKNVVIIGGGISGLSAAHYLAKRGIGIDIVERERSVGGSCKSILKDEKYILEFGPHYFRSSDKALMKLARELSIEPLSTASKINPNRRYIYGKKGLFKVPTSASKLFTSSPLSVRGKARLLREPFIRSRSGESESVASFAIRRFGRIAYERVIAPIFAARFAGDPDQLEIRSTAPNLVDIETENGSILKRFSEALPRIPDDGLMSFKWGMGTLTARLEEGMRQRIMSGVAADRILMGDDGRFVVPIDVSAREITADAVILAVSAPEAARMLMEIEPEIVTPLMGISYASLVVAHVAYKKDSLPRDFSGIGFVASKRSNLRMLGLINSSGCFAGKCREPSEVLYSVLYGGAMDPDFIDKDEDEIRSIVASDMEASLGIKAQFDFISIQRWPEAIPQYTMGHKKRIASIKKHLKNIPGIFLAGNYFSGISVSDAIAHSRNIVDDVTLFLKSTQNGAPRFKSVEADVSLDCNS